MPYINHQGIRIHYQLEGDGLPLVLQHGWSGSVEHWRDFGYVDQLKRDYRLILIDARGRGDSDTPEDLAAYDTQRMAEDVVAVLDALQVDRAHFLGYSMGGWIGFHLAGFAPQRFCSLILGGAHPYPESLASLRELAGKGTKAIFALWDEMAAPLSPQSRRRLLEHDTAPLLASCVTDRPDLSAVLTTMTMPCLVYVGEADDRYAGAKECVESIANGVFLSLPGLGHLEAYVRSDLLLPHVTEFLAGVNPA